MIQACSSVARIAPVVPALLSKGAHAISILGLLLHDMETHGGVVKRQLGRRGRCEFQIDREGSFW